MPATLFPILVADIHVTELRPRKQVLGVMNQIALETGWHIERSGGLRHTDTDELNRHLRRTLHAEDGGYRLPLELIHERLDPA